MKKCNWIAFFHKTKDVKNFDLVKNFGKIRGSGCLICLTDKPRHLNSQDYLISV